jgi:hypothetical protein
LDLARNRKVAGFFLPEIFRHTQNGPARPVIAGIVNVLPFRLAQLTHMLRDPRSLSPAGTRNALRYSGLPQVLMRLQGPDILRKRTTKLTRHESSFRRVACL